MYVYVKEKIVVFNQYYAKPPRKIRFKRLKQ